jgi:hypothetical protein
VVPGRAVVGDERVYAVVTGQVRLVMTADNAGVAEAGYTGLSAELAPFVTELGSPSASKLLAKITSEVTAATGLTTGVSANALALTPAGYPGNRSQIKTWTYQLRQVAADLRSAKRAVARIESIASSEHRLHVVSPGATTTPLRPPQPPTTSPPTTTSSTTTSSTTTSSTTTTTN